MARLREETSHLVKIEVETSNLKQVEEALSAGADIIMLDNMDIHMIRKAVEIIGGKALVEVSGNVTRKDIRELADTGVAVIHLAPRAIDTPLNSAAVNALNAELKNHSDSPDAAAAQIVAALRQGVAERHLGFPERLFAWLNGVAPRLIDRGLADKLATIKKHARSTP